MEANAGFSRSTTARESHATKHAGGDVTMNAQSGPVMRLPAKVCSSAGSRCGEYDARRLRSQREIIRDVMLAAADCDTWLTLGELRALTRYGEASISAQLRHLRKFENGGYAVVKRHREVATVARSITDGRGECVWEYHMDRGTNSETRASSAGGEGGVPQALA